MTLTDGIYSVVLKNLKQWNDTPKEERVEVETFFLNIEQMITLEK